MFIKVEYLWNERIRTSQRVWNHFNVGKWGYNIVNDQNIRNQSLQFHLSQIAINGKIHNRTRVIQLNGFCSNYPYTDGIIFFLKKLFVGFFLCVVLHQITKKSYFPKHFCALPFFFQTLQICYICPLYETTYIFPILEKL